MVDTADTFISVVATKSAQVVAAFHQSQSFAALWHNNISIFIADVAVFNRIVGDIAHSVAILQYAPYRQVSATSIQSASKCLAHYGSYLCHNSGDRDMCFCSSQHRS